MPTLLFKREVETEDTVPHKRRRISEQEESFESVNSIEDETEEEFNPFLSDNSHRKSSFFCSGSNKENIPEITKEFEKVATAGIEPVAVKVS